VKITRRQLIKLIRENIDKSVKKDTIMPVGDDYKWIPWDDTTVYLGISDVNKLKKLPARGIAPASFEAELNTQKKSMKIGKSGKTKYSPQWRLKGLATYVFGTMSQHSYTDKQPGLELHPSSKKYMLPPSWTIALSNGVKRSEILKDKLKSAKTPESKKEIALTQGYTGTDPVKDLEKDINKFDNIDHTYV
jgi:hypothetical protein